MRNLQLTLCMACLLLLPQLMSAQVAVAASGGEASGSGGSASFTVGQMFYQNISDTGGTISEGVQQPFEIFIPVSLESDLSINLSVYPNPTLGQLQLEINTDRFDGMRYQLLSLQGRSIASAAVSQPLTQIDMSRLAQGTYFIRVMREGQLLQTIKIIIN